MIKKFVFVFVCLMAFTVVRAQFSSTGLKVSTIEKPSHIETSVRAYVDSTWKNLQISPQDPVKSILDARDRTNGYITVQVTKEIEYARFYNASEALRKIMEYCKSLDVKTVRTFRGLEAFFSGIDLKSKEIGYHSRAKAVADDYFALRYIIRDLSGAAVADSVKFINHYWDWQAANMCPLNREILEIGNAPLTEDYLLYLKNAFAYNGYSRLEALRPYVEQLMPEGKLKAELTKLFELFYTTRNGLPAPEFSLTGYDGKQYTLKDFRGKVLVVDVWATWCSGCILGIPKYMKMREAYKDRTDIEFITISTDDKPSEKQWRKKVEELQLTGVKNLITYRDDAFQVAYTIYGIPRYFLIDKEGNIVTLFAPSSGADFINLIDKTLNK